MKPPPLPLELEELILVTSEEIAGRTIARSLGMVSGNTTQALGLKGSLNFTGGGGEVSGITEFQSAAHLEAERKMRLEAKQLDADAIVAVRYQISAISGALYSVFCYGTAVRTLAGNGE